MIAEELALYLCEKGHGIQNVDLFLGFQPDDLDDCATVYDETSPALGESQALSVDQFGVQVLVRNSSYTTARNALMAIHKSLVGFGGRRFITGGSMVSVVFIDTPPTSIGKDDKGRNEWSAHYRVRVESEGDLYRT